MLNRMCAPSAAELAVITAKSAAAVTEQGRSIADRAPTVFQNKNAGTIPSTMSIMVWKFANPARR